MTTITLQEQMDKYKCSRCGKTQTLEDMNIRLIETKVSNSPVKYLLNLDFTCACGWHVFKKQEPAQ